MQTPLGHGQEGDRQGPRPRVLQFAGRSGRAEALGLVWEESGGTGHGEGQEGRAGVDKTGPLPWTMALA